MDLEYSDTNGTHLLGLQSFQLSSNGFSSPQHYHLQPYKLQALIADDSILKLFLVIATSGIVKIIFPEISSAFGHGPANTQDTRLTIIIPILQVINNQNGYH